MWGNNKIMKVRDLPGFPKKRYPVTNNDVPHAFNRGHNNAIEKIGPLEVPCGGLDLLSEKELNILWEDLINCKRENFKEFICLRFGTPPSSLVPFDEKEIWALTKDIPDTKDYEWRGDQGDYTPNDNEKILMEDYLAGYLEEFVKLICSKFGRPAPAVPSVEITREYWINSFLQELIDLKSYPSITSKSENATTKSDMIEQLIDKYRALIAGGKNESS